MKSTACAGLFIAAIFLLASSSIVRAQVVAHSGEVAGSFGYNITASSEQNASLDGGNFYGSLSGDNGSHPYYGGSGGYNVSGLITLLGEYKYQPLGTFTWTECGCWPVTSTATSQVFGGGVRFNFRNSTKVVPFALITLGGSRYLVSDSGGISSSGIYEDIGGGVSYYIGKNFGVRPELRIEMQDLYPSGGVVEVDRFLASGSVFFQFGGTAKKKK
jgi:hypothetical protein